MSDIAHICVEPITDPMFAYFSDKLLHSPLIFAAQLIALCVKVTARKQKLSRPDHSFEGFLEFLGVPLFEGSAFGVIKTNDTKHSRGHIDIPINAREKFIKRFIYEVDEGWGRKAQLTRLEVPEGTSDHFAKGYVIHPGILDSTTRRTQCGLVMFVNMNSTQFDFNDVSFPVEIDARRWDSCDASDLDSEIKKAKYGDPPISCSMIASHTTNPTRQMLPTNVTSECKYGNSCKRAVGKIDANMPHYGVTQSETPLDIDRMLGALGEVVRRHGALFAVLAWKEELGKLEQTIYPPSSSRHPLLTLPATPTQQRGPTKSVLHSTSANFRLDRLPPLIATMFDLGDGDRRSNCHSSHLT
ncbi:hypothetical protein BU15DRAFT_83211 [Melanogaster broomeanus]|nr:hypothetical protein BU15DRAFT_83211 [Melanogaster broomeanus]